jgi:hypothetical protein
MLIPIEPVSLKTLEAADAALDAAKRLNPNIQHLGILATMFDENDTQHRTLILELRSQRSHDLIDEPIPLDLGLAHRAAQKIEQRTRPVEATRQAYHTTGDFVVQSMGLGKLYSSEPVRTTTSFTPHRPADAGKSNPGVKAPPVVKPTPVGTSTPLIPDKNEPTSRGASPLVLAVAVFVIALILLGIGLFLKNSRPSHSARPESLRPVSSNPSRAPHLAHF